MEKSFDRKVDESEFEPLSKNKTAGLYPNTQKTDWDKRYVVISDTRRALSQYCASCALSLLMISFGTSFGFSTILLSDLTEAHEKDKNYISLSQLTWISTINYFAVVIGALFSGLLSQWIGRRNSLIVSTVPFVISWLSLYMCGPTQLWPIFFGLLLLGISGGIIESPLQIYVTEVSEPRLRSSMCASLGVTIMIGVFIQILLGKYMHWRTLALVNASFPVLGLMSLFFVPESPHWLASKGRYEESLKALAWLRGWCPVSQLPQHEFQEIISSLSKETEKPRSIKRYFKLSALSPFALVCFIFFVSCFNGSVAILSWAIMIFQQVKSPMNEYTAAIILAFVQLASTVIVMITFPYIGKRKPTLFSLAATGVALFVVALYIYDEQANLQTSWTPTIAILLSIGFSFLGVKHVPWILAGELFSVDLRSQMAGILAGSCQVFSAVASKYYIYMVQTLTLSGTYFCFACVNFVGFLVLYYVMPETEGKTLADIEHETNKSHKKSAKEMP